MCRLRWPSSPGRDAHRENHTPSSAKDSNLPRLKPPLQNQIKNTRGRESFRNEEAEGLGWGLGETDRQKGGLRKGAQQASAVGKPGRVMPYGCDRCVHS